jgi:hypothetical protein
MMIVRERRLKVPMTPNQLARKLRKDGFRVRRHMPLTEAAYMRWDFFLTNEPSLWVNSRRPAALAAFDALHEDKNA